MDENDDSHEQRSAVGGGRTPSPDHRWAAPAPGRVKGMASPYETHPPRVRVGAGTAFKAGFFGALGVVASTLVLSIVLGVLALVLAAAGLFPAVARYFQG